MSVREVTRAEFRRAIEAGIEAAGDLPDDMVAALRAVADRKRKVSLTFDGCPATLAGLYETCGNEVGGTYTDYTSRVRRFVRAYDKALPRGMDDDSGFFRVVA